MQYVLGQHIKHGRSVRSTTTSPRVLGQACGAQGDVQREIASPRGGRAKFKRGRRLGCSPARLGRMVIAQPLVFPPPGASEAGRAWLEVGGDGGHKQVKGRC